MDKRNEKLLAVEMKNFQLKGEISVLKGKFDGEKSQLKKELKENFDEENFQLKEKMSQLTEKFDEEKFQLKEEISRLKGKFDEEKFQEISRLKKKFDEENSLSKAKYSQLNAEYNQLKVRLTTVQSNIHLNHIINRNTLYLSNLTFHLISTGPCSCLEKCLDMPILHLLDTLNLHIKLRCEHY